MRKLTSGSTIVVASWDDAKINRVRDALAPFRVEVASLDDAVLPEPQVDERIPREVAVLKALIVAQTTSQPAVSEETGFQIDALDGRYGYRLDIQTYPEDKIPQTVENLIEHLRASKKRRFGSGEPTRDIDGLMDLVDDCLNRIGCCGPDDRNASFTCALCLAWPDGDYEVFESRIEGQLTTSKRVRYGPHRNAARGNEGEGFDPYFVPEGETRTFGEMNRGARNAILQSRVYDLLRKGLSSSH